MYTFTALVTAVFMLPWILALLIRLACAASPRFRSWTLRALFGPEAPGEAPHGGEVPAQAYIPT